MEIVETWYFQIWVNFGGMADRQQFHHGCRHHDHVFRVHNSCSRLNHVSVKETRSKFDNSADLLASVCVEFSCVLSLPKCVLVNIKIKGEVGAVKLV